jgi:hypothetical protein
MERGYEERDYVAVTTASTTIQECSQADDGTEQTQLSYMEFDKKRQGKER